MGSYLLDLIVEELRYKALHSIIRAYQEKLSFTFIINLLAFDSEQEFIDVAHKLNLVIDEEQSVLLTKESRFNK